MQTSPEVDIFNLPDDEVMNMAAPPAALQPADPAPDPEPEPEPTPDNEEPQDPDADAGDESDPDPAADPEPEPESDPEPEPEPDALSAEDDKIPTPAGKTEPAKPAVEDPAKKPVAEDPAPAKTEPDPAAKKDEPVEKAPLTVEQKAAALDSLMEFKANGKMVKLESPEEALRLLQMGANYTKKMQQLQPVMRLHKMLENNKLSDPTQLSYLIDLHQKKPEAIQKLLADSKFDPLTIDAEQAAKYKPTNHQVSDTEVQFGEVLQEVEASEEGRQFVTEIAEQWDQESRRALYREPRLLSALQEQRSLGLYALINTEIERRRMLGELQGVPFIQAYEKVGADLQASGKLVRPAQPSTEPVKQEPQKEPAKTPVEVRTKQPAAKLKDSDRAKAASVPRTKPDTKAQEEENFLEMPDSEFLQQFQGRL